MTEISTSNDINNKTHQSQPLQNSLRQHFNPSSSPSSKTLSKNIHQQHSPQHFVKLNKHLKQTHLHLQQNHKNNQQTLALNSSANILSSNNINTPTQSSKHQQYKNPLNSPNNSTFPYATTTQQQQQLLQQHLRAQPRVLPQTQYQRYLNDLLLQQQQLQKQQQKLLGAKHEDDELSEESLKQNVAIVLNNLDRYNTALRSIILNEEVSSNSSVLLDDEQLLFGSSSSNNNNFLMSSILGQQNKMAAATAATPESDYNSNATTPGARNESQCAQQQQQHLVGYGTAAAAANAFNVGGGLGVNNSIIVAGNGGGGGGFYSLGNNVSAQNLNCSLASSSHDFTHDNSDYQWFLDYGYRDGCAGMQRSVLSSLSGSYNGLGDLIYYDDLAKNLDANLAEVDMESFRAEDIHSLLSHLPSYCKSLGGNNSKLQQSLMLQQHMLPHLAQQHAHNSMSQVSTTSTSELIDNSICKSELLFSPVKESHISVDSLDMNAYDDEADIILTCQANKDNYTIAFEGSVLYSDESFYAEPNEMALKHNKQNFINLHRNLEDIVKRKSLDASMTRSDQLCPGNAKLQKSSTMQLQRYPSGNNNTSDDITSSRHIPLCMSVRKSNSLPNLRAVTTGCEAACQQQLNVSTAVCSSITAAECGSKSTRNLLPMCQMPISCNSISESTSERLTTQCQQLQQLQQQQQQHMQTRHKHRCSCSNATVAASAQLQHQHQQQKNNAHISGSTSSGNSNPPAFNLVKLFIKQKSCSSGSGGGGVDADASAHTCMDVSSGCWPSSDAAGSSSSSSLEQRLRKKSMNDSGKGSALSKHDEEDMLMQQACDADAEESVFAHEQQQQSSTPKRAARAREHAVLYDDANSSSAGSHTANNSPAHRRRSMPMRHAQLSHLLMQRNVAAAATCTSQSSDEATGSNTEPLTQLHFCKDAAATQSKAGIKSASSSDMITRSMQTSCGTLSARSSLNERLRCVPPSFLANLNNLGQERQAPIYVIYPNYALPDLGFVQMHATADVIFSPFNYKMAVGGGSSSSLASLKKRCSMSDNDDEILKTMDYKHVQDWQSLATLLPVEYRKRLKHIPEVQAIAQQLDSELSQRPLFCMTPPIRRNRAHVCDCAQYFQQQNKQEGSSSSGSSQQPSSGYRGSSTLLSDSELCSTDPLKQMYVYQYEQQRMDSGVELSPAQASKTPPTPMPRGILRKTASARIKRNSMIEEQQTKLSKLEKRRSLQEPPYQHNLGSIEQLCEVFEEELGTAAEASAAMPQPRLSRKDLDARARAENFLSSLPRNELKHYAEIAAILESSSEQPVVQYDAAALKKEVSRALSQQKKVSFNDMQEQQKAREQAHANLQRFSTPPNSPNISLAAGGGSNARHAAAKPATLEALEERKIQSNRYKRLQIQWELMSKDSNMLKDLANMQHTKSGGSTPTAATAAAIAQKSRIPRPVSYPAGKKIETTKTVAKPIESNKITPTKVGLTKKLSTNCVSPQIARVITQDAHGKKTTTRSPSRILPPKRYSVGAASPGTAVTTPPSKPSTPTSATRARTPTGVGGSGGGGIVAGTYARTPTSSRASSATAPSTPKRRVQSPRTTNRVR